MKPIERVFTTLSFREADKIPLFQLYSVYGAKELDMPIKEYFSNPQYVLEAQFRMQKKYKNDCLNSFFYASIEHEAFGGKTIFSADGPPNAGAPIIYSIKDIENLKVPDIESSLPLQKILQTIRLLKQESHDEIPVLGSVISPFSLPVIQMGFGPYLELMIGDSVNFWKLMEINKEFCINWANAQLEAGATALGYFDPVSSPSIIPREMYKKTGWVIAKEVIAKIKGSTATHFASGISYPLVDDLVETKTNIIAASVKEDLGRLKDKAYNRLSVIGNLNGVEMCRWTKEDAENAVKDIILKAGKGGGFLISDTHGEIPFQVPEKVLVAIAETVEKYGVYTN